MISTNQFLDRAERALENAHRERLLSETSFLQQLLREVDDSISTLGLSPAELFRSALYNQPLMSDMGELLKVIAVPMQRPKDALRAGDVMLRAVPGTGDVGHVAVLISGELFRPSQVAQEGISAEGMEPGYYGMVIEGGAFPHTRTGPFARRFLDTRGRAPANTLILRPRLGELSLSDEFTLPASEDMRKLLVEWSRYFQKNATLETSPDTIRSRSVLMSTLLSAPDRERELDLLKQACENPLLGISLVLSCMPGTAVRQAQRWWDLIFAEQNAKGALFGWNIKNLPAPTRGTKYLIISDLHRDAASDDLGPLKPGSISHFKKNEQIYRRILDYAAAQNYILLEAGDCEELWFVRSLQDYPRKPNGALDIAAKLREIISSHPAIYERLRQLHKNNRYYRIYGNHDSFLKSVGSDNAIGQVIKIEMERDGGPPFVIYDAFIIDGVKTMMEHDGFAALSDAAALVTGSKTPRQFLDSMITGRLGLDANDYTDKCRMLVTHGHQFDVWNSPENEILGLLIANTVGTFVDRNMDPFLDIQGVAWEGNPLIQFADLFSRWPVMNSWPAKLAAVRYAHQVKHSPNDQRLLTDSLVFSETVASLYGAFGIALNYRDERGNEITPEQSRKGLDLSSPLGIAEYLRRHHFHHLCIGHTHHPHSQPYLTLDELAKIVFPLAPVIRLIQSLLPDFLQPQLKSMYFNSGTGGWMEGVVWAIEIDETGQARLVFWTANSSSPEYMDWELQPLQKYVRDHLLEGVATAFKAPATEVIQNIQDIYAKLKQRFTELNVPYGATANALGRSPVLPVHALAAALMQAHPQGVRTRQLQEAGRSVQDGIKDLRMQYDRLRSFTLDVLLSVKRRALRGFASTGEQETCIIHAPISPALRTRLDQFKRILMMMDMTEDHALHYGALALSAFHRFPNNLPFFSTLAEPLNGAARLEESESPVLDALLSTLWMYPPAGQTVEVRGVSIQSKFAIEDSNVSLAVTLTRSARDTNKSSSQPALNVA